MIQVPDFGDRFYVYALYDERTDEIARIGKQYGTKPGFLHDCRAELEWRGSQRHHRGRAFLHGPGVCRPANVQGR